MTEYFGIRLHEDDRARLARLDELLRGSAQQLIEDFYVEMDRRPDFAAYLPTGAGRERLMRAQAAYFSQLLSQRDPEQYAERRRAVGRAHHRVGLPQCLYTQSYAIYLDLLLERAEQVLEDEDDRAATLRTLCRAVMLDTSLVHEAWDEARREAEAKLKERERELEASRRMESVGRLASGVAHDLNNLLAAVTATVGTLRMTREDDRELMSDLDIVEGATHRGRRLARQLLGLSRPERRRPRVVDLCERVKDFSKLLERLVDTSCSLTVVAERDAVLARIDPNRLERILLNLVMNAQQALADDGQITLHIGALELGTAEAQLWDLRAGSYAFIEVQDDGCGMSEEVATRVFEPRFSTKKASGGNGLGLAMVSTMAKEARGRVRVWSEEGVGSRFRLLLPLATGCFDARQPEGASPQGRGELVLVVDDDSRIRAATRRLLNAAGYKVEQATGIIDGIEAARGQVDLILTDMLLEDGSGRVLVEAVRRERPVLPIVMRSGDPQAIEAMRADFPDLPCIRKPEAPRELLQVIRDALDAG